MKVIEANSKVMYKFLDELIDGVGVDKVKEGLELYWRADFQYACPCWLRKNGRSYCS